MPRFSHEKLIAILQDFHEKYGRSPVKNDFRSGLLPVRNEDTFRKRFNGYAKALKAAGLEPYKGGRKGRSGRKKYTNEQREAAAIKNVAKKKSKSDSLSFWQEALERRRMLLT